jgi:hypothetical protein
VSENAAQNPLPQPTKPAMVTRINNTIRSLTGSFNFAAAEEHLNDHLNENASGKWCKVACMSRVMKGHGRHDGIANVRRNMANLFKRLLQKGVLLSTERSGKHGAITACKILEKDADDVAKKLLLDQIHRMQQRNELSQKSVSLAMRLLEA